MTIKNQLKTVLLIGILTGILLGIGKLLGGNLGMTVALIFSLGFNLLIYWYSDKIALWMYKAKPANEKEYKELHKMVAEIARLSGIPKPKVYIIPSEQPNAFATGRSPSKASVAFTQGILKLLDKNELRGVTAHEISHVRNRDTLVTTIAAAIAGIISYIAMMVRFGAMSDDREGNNFIYLIVIGILTPIIAMLIQLAISRAREYLADESGAKAIKNSLSLASALEKLESSKTPMKLGSEATSSLFIVNPFRGSAMLSLLSTHPPLQERVKRLREMKV